MRRSAVRFRSAPPGTSSPSSAHVRTEPKGVPRTTAAGSADRGSAGQASMAGHRCYSTGPRTPVATGRDPGDRMPTVLLVEDDAAIRALIEEALAERGLQVRAAADGRAAQRVLE